MKILTLLTASTLITLCAFNVQGSNQPHSAKPQKHSKPIVSSKKYRSLKKQVNTNTKAIESLTSSASSNSSYFLEDNNGEKIGDIITMSSDAQDVVVILNSIDMVVKFYDLTEGRMSNQGSSLDYSEPDCQGQPYVYGNDSINLSRVAGNGILIGFNELVNQLIYIPPNAILSDIVVKSSWNSYNGCHSYEEISYQTERLITPALMPLPDSLVWQCPEGDYNGNECENTLRLSDKYLTPFFISK